MIKFILITNDPALAHHAESCGVDRIFVDLEQIGKQERQGHLDTLINTHCMEDVARVKKSLTRADLLVRLNPLYDGTKQEIDDAISGGADILMLPMFQTAEEVHSFVDLVGGRSQIIPLLETHDAAKAIDEIVCVPGLSELYIGLNDLHLDMQLKFMFELLANGFVDSLVESIKDAGLPFGFGGIARVGEGTVPGELVLAEHLRLGSSSVILSRTFHRKSEGISEFKANLNLKNELDKLYVAGVKLKTRSPEQATDDHRRLQTIVSEFVADQT